MLLIEAGPYFWNADTIYKFLKATYDVVKIAVESIRIAELKALGTAIKKTNPVGPNEHLQTQDDIKLVNFVNQLSGESQKPFCAKTWVDLMRTQVFDILKRNEYNVDIIKIDNDETKRRCVIQLLRLIRNKMKYRAEVKPQLPMVLVEGEKKDSLHFREDLFFIGSQSFQD